MQGLEHPARRTSGGRGLYRAGVEWGNPYRIGRDGTRADVIALYERYLRKRHDLLRALDELRGKDLVCFCAPLPCHGDLLRRLANATRAERIAWWREAA